MATGLSQVVDSLRSKGIDPIMFGRTVIFNRPVPDLVMEYGKIDGVDLYVNNHILDTEKLTSFLKNLAQEKRIKYIDKQELLCPKNKCTVLSKRRGHLIFLDRSHWTLDGAREFSIRLKKKYPNLDTLLTRKQISLH